MFRDSIVACLALVLLVGLTLGARAAGPPAPTRTPLLRAVDLDVGESSTVELSNGTSAQVKLLALDELRDTIRDAVRRAEVKLEVNGQPIKLTSGNYRLPVTVAGVQVDCPVTRGYLKNSTADPWGLDKEARLRLWPAGSPWIEPGTFLYPPGSAGSPTRTQMANEPSHVDGGENPVGDERSTITTVSTSAGPKGWSKSSPPPMAWSSPPATLLPGYEDSPVEPRYDVVYLLDERGWYYRYSHLQTIDPAIKPGATVEMGQKIGLLGKEGGSGGWSHLHFEIVSRQPSGKWGTQEGYAFLWQATCASISPAVWPSPGRTTWPGPARRSCSTQHARGAAGTIARLRVDLQRRHDRDRAQGRADLRQPGDYSEVLKVTDDLGNVDYDFAVVQVLDREKPEQCRRRSTRVLADLGHQAGRSGHVQGAHLPHHRRQRDVGFRRWQSRGGNPVRRQRDDHARKRLCHRHPPLSQAGRLPRPRRADRRPRAEGDRAALRADSAGGEVTSPSAVTRRRDRTPALDRAKAVAHVPFRLAARSR